VLQNIKVCTHNHASDILDTYEKMYGESLIQRQDRERKGLFLIFFCCLHHPQRREELNTLCMIYAEITEGERNYAKEENM
jgi:hypothetical protein